MILTEHVGKFGNFHISTRMVLKTIFHILNTIHPLVKGLGAKLLIGIRKMVDVLPSGFNPPDYLIFAHGKVCLISALISSEVLH